MTRTVWAYMGPPFRLILPYITPIRTCTCIFEVYVSIYINYPSAARLRPGRRRTRTMGRTAARVAPEPMARRPPTQSARQQGRGVRQAVVDVRKSWFSNWKWKWKWKWKSWESRLFPNKKSKIAVSNSKPLVVRGLTTDSMQRSREGSPDTVFLISKKIENLKEKMKIWAILPVENWSLCIWSDHK